VQQEVGGDTLLKSLELIAHGGMIIYPRLLFSETVRADGLLAENLYAKAASGR
jgi:hypothetical protein